MTTPYPQNLSAKLPMVNADGAPSGQFQRFWQTSIARIEQGINDAATAQTAAATAQTTANGKQPADATLTALAALDAAAGLLEQTGADAFAKRALGTAAGTSVPTLADADGRYVQQDQAARPSYSAYGGHTASATYVQTEAQATDDAVKALSAAVVALLTALHAAKVLT